MFVFHNLLREIRKVSKQLDDLNSAVSVLSSNVDALIAKQPASPPPAEDLAPVTAAVNALNSRVVAALGGSTPPTTGTVIEHIPPAV